MDLNLNIFNLQKNYQGKTALLDCSCGFARGGVHVLMGPNGCGKSTLLRVCALLEPIDGGEIVYTEGGKPLPHDIILRRRMTLLLPRIGVFNATVFKNVAYGLTVRNAGRTMIEHKVDASLAAVGLIHKKHHKALTLSSGETQRLGIARAMAIDPEILFLDEPTASIDEENTGMVEEIILSLKKAGTTTMVITTHDREQAERLADTIIMMRNGRILPGRPA